MIPNIKQKLQIRILRYKINYKINVGKENDIHILNIFYVLLFYIIVIC